MRDGWEHSVRAWLLHVEQMWNAGDLNGCLGCLHPGARARHRCRATGYAGLARWLRSHFALSADSQIRFVIEWIDVRADEAQVRLRVHCRCTQSMQLQESDLYAVLKLAQSEGKTWLIESIEV